MDFFNFHIEDCNDLHRSPSIIEKIGKFIIKLWQYFEKDKESVLNFCDEILSKDAKWDVPASSIYLCCYRC